MIALVSQRTSRDCGVAVLSMWLHVSYEDVYALAVKRFGANLKKFGLSLRDMRGLAKTLGHPMRTVHHRKVDIEEDSGILGINGARMVTGGHWVVLRKGTIIDPDKAQVWDAQEYVTVHQARVGSLLTEDV